MTYKEKKMMKKKQKTRVKNDYRIQDEHWAAKGYYKGQQIVSSPISLLHYGSAPDLNNIQRQESRFNVQERMVLDINLS